MYNEKKMRFEVTTIGNCFLHGFNELGQAFEYCNSLDIPTKVFDLFCGIIYEISGEKR